MNIYYIHDPMCSWCWAFRPALDYFSKHLPEDIPMQYLLGGLAKDTEEPMPEELRQQTQNHWRTIETRVPGTKFNYNFWKDCQPRRSTYPACRAVLAAKHQDMSFEKPMIVAIQEAYYLQARNPSDTETLIELADDIQLDVDTFCDQLHSEDMVAKLKDEIIFVRKMGGNSFPMLLLGEAEQYHQIMINYNQPEKMLQEVERYISQ